MKIFYYNSENSVENMYWLTRFYCILLIDLKKIKNTRRKIIVLLLYILHIILFLLHPFITYCFHLLVSMN